MSGLARNFAVARGTAPFGATRNVYTVPVNNNLILKSILLGYAQGTATSVKVYVVASGGAYYNEILDVAADTSGRTIANPWTVLNQGDFIQIAIDTGIAYYWIAGALLQVGATIGPALGIAAPPASGEVWLVPYPFNVVTPV